MKRVRWALTALIAAAVAASGGYAVADAHDLVPGVLTLPPPIPAGLTDLPVAPPSPSSTPAPPPTAAGVAATLAPILADPALGPGAGAVVRDAESGEILLAHDADRPRTIASAQKLLSALVITDHLDAEGVMTTSVVDEGGGSLVLVAAGDTLLASGAGDPAQVVGRAGLADLAAQVAAAAPPGPLSVRLDTSYAAGPRVPAAWEAADVALGFTREVSMIGLADNRPRNGVVRHHETDADVLAAFVAALVAAGRPATAAPPGPPPAPTATRLGAVHSATHAEVLAHGMAESDNAILENLARQAMVAAGIPVPADGDSGPFITAGLVAAGISEQGLRILDASGLAPGQLVPLRVVDEVLALGLGERHPGMRRVIADLPVAGLTGTLSRRFDQSDTVAAAGVPRAKSGTLTGVGTLAGVTTDARGRLLAFVVGSDTVPRSYEGTISARAAFDRFAAALTACGCR